MEFLRKGLCEALRKKICETLEAFIKHQAKFNKAPISLATNMLPDIFTLFSILTGIREPVLCIFFMNSPKDTYILNSYRWYNTCIMLI